MDIRSGYQYPSGELSNFYSHNFIFDGVECNSFEGFIQSITHKNIERQKEVCLFVGREAKTKGYKKWFIENKLYWNGVEYDRDSQEYQDLLDRAYNALYDQCKLFRKALASTIGGTLTHIVGTDKDTLLTREEFCSRLLILRDYGKIER